eukprot:COSAG02_NODE_120_length_35326_cov_39.000823_9_plen_140_part_00
MAMVGLECDQVQRNATGDGRDVSVPINAAYNHHFTVTLAGAKTALERVEFSGPDDSRRQEFSGSQLGVHGLPDVVYRARELEPGVGGVATSLGLGGGNGGDCAALSHFVHQCVSHRSSCICLQESTARPITDFQLRMHG